MFNPFKKTNMKYFLLLFFLVLSHKTIAQEVYKTPSGKKYHLASCRMVENVSKQLLGVDQISKFKLTPCKICNPPLVIKNKSNINNSTNKAVGEAESVRCKGTTQKGTRCKHKTRLANGYCYQHTKQNNKSDSKNL